MKQEWLLLDMHMHSEYSRINKKGDTDKVKQMSADEFVKTLFDKKVKIFSITDHNYYSKKYYDEIDKYITDNNLDMKLINGVELDVYVELKDKSEDFIHICVYFDDDVDRENLEETINNLYKDKEGNELNPHFTKILDELHSLNSKFIVIPHGDKERGIFNDYLIDKLSITDSPEFYKYAMYKVFNAFDVKLKFLDKSNDFWASNFCEYTRRYNSIIDNKSPKEIEQMEKNITEKIKNREYKLSEEDNLIYEYILEYGSYFTYFVFSDWHNAEEYKPKINNFIFGSLEYAFSAFEMATLDPTSRIIKSQDFEIDIPPTILEKVNFKINGIPKEVHFSPGLNAVVGKRGSGKSLLLAVIKNLKSQDAEDGALKKYKTLKVSDISAENRGSIKLSLGSLNSVAFLTQDEIKEIFENPNKAQENIASNFLEIRNLDISGINKIVNIGEKIKPYNTDYKNITTNILAIKKSDNYNYSINRLLEEGVIKSNFVKIENEFTELISNIEKLKLNSELLVEEKERVKKLKELYLSIIDSYNTIIDNHNNRIAEINSKRTNNQITNNQNMNDITTALDNIKNNIEIQLNVEKLKILLTDFKIENPPVELYKKGKYLFVTYYEIPDDLNKILKEKILGTITWSSSNFEDLYKYLEGNDSKKLKANYNTIVDELKKMINGDFFKAKKEFYEIKTDSIDYKNKIKNMEDLKYYVQQNDIVNLTNASPGMKSVAYLDMLFDLEDKILILDQPEDNIDNDYISNYLVPNIKNKKQVKQLIFVTHNPSVAVYGDAFNYIYVENDGNINYTNYLIEKAEDKEKLINILEGGRASFSNRNKKFGDVLGEEEYEISKRK